MRIALFVHVFLPGYTFGTEIYTYNLAKQLKLLKHDVVIVTTSGETTSRHNNTYSYYEYDDIPVYCINRSLFPVKRLRDTYYQPQLYKVFEEILKHTRPDIIHATHLANHTVVLLNVAKALHIPVIASFTDFFGICNNSHLQRATGTLCRGPSFFGLNCIYCRLIYEKQHEGAGYFPSWSKRLPFLLLCYIKLKYFSKIKRYNATKISLFIIDLVKRTNVIMSFYQKLQAVIVPTQFAKDIYVAHGVRVPIFNIRFGVELGHVSRKLSKRNRLITIGYIGRISPNKGLDILLDALKHVPCDKMRLEVYGDGDQLSEYTEKVKRMAEGLPVVFRGRFSPSEIGNVLSDLDFVTIPSTWHENSPLVLLNALASHTPVIVSDVAGMTEFISEGKNGFIFKRGNSQELSNLLTEIINNPEIAEVMARETDYSQTTNKMTKETEDVYKEVLSRWSKHDQKHDRIR